MCAAAIWGRGDGFAKGFNEQKSCRGIFGRQWAENAEHNLCIGEFGGLAAAHDKIAQARPLRAHLIIVLLKS